MNWGNCYLLVNNQAYRQYFDATGKAPEDIEHILLDAGVRQLESACCDSTNKDVTSNKLKGYVSEMAKAFQQARNIASRLSDGSVLIYQHPSVFFGNYPELFFFFLFLKHFCLFKRKSIKVMLIVHDLPSVRYQDQHLLNWERKIFPYASYVVSHNERMTEYITKTLAFKGKIANLHIFDYLVKNNKGVAPHVVHSPATIAFAGNLIKPGFIPQLKNLKGECEYHLYGREHNKMVSILSDSCQYKGCFPPEILPSKMDEDFGLIWDGDTIDGVSGNLGEYMRYNNPHKLSLYMAAHIPVIVWKEAAIAEFVINNNVGFAVNSLKEIGERLKNISQENYDLMYSNTIRVANCLEKGESIMTAITQLLDRQTNNTPHFINQRFYK